MFIGLDRSGNHIVRNIFLYWGSSVRVQKRFPFKEIRNRWAKVVSPPVQEGASGSSAVICSTSVQSFGNPLDRMNLSRRFKQAIKVLGPDCCSSIHDGRHSFASIVLAAGRTLPEVRDALGHRNISTTSVYLHALDDGTVGSIFE